MFELSDDQGQCVDKAVRWYSTDPKKRKPWFRIDGNAGTGKTTIIQAIIRRLIDAGLVTAPDVQYVAPTGKAALVMRRKGCDDASTIHKKIYSNKGQTGPDTALVRDLEAAIAARLSELTSGGREYNPEQDPGPDSALVKLYRKLEDAESKSQPLWKVNAGSQLHGAKLLVLSEASMVDERVALDLLEFKVPILLEGDPNQLKPVFGRAYFMRGEPNFKLTQVHRQGKGSPILEMARMARMGQPLKLGDYGDGCMVVDKLPLELALAADQIIVGRNATRHDRNSRMRVLRGFMEKGADPKVAFLPKPGEKLICLRNDNEVGLLNGALYQCIGADVISSTRILLGAADEDDGQEVSVRCHSELFKGAGQSKLPAYALQQKGVQQFDFGYVVTCHKAQGSQWPFVVVYDESNDFSDRREWLYTACTRPSQRLVVVRQQDKQHGPVH